MTSPPSKRGTRVVPRLFTATLILIALIAVPLAHARAQEGGDPPPGTGVVTIHIVASGETLASIATRYGVTVDAIRVANSLSAYEDLVVGQRMVIPAAGAVDPLATESTIIGVGDSLYTIAARLGVPVGLLGKQNMIVNPDLLAAGQEIIIPITMAGEAWAVTRLADGELLSRTALQANASPAAIQMLNELEAPWLVESGALLRVPVGDDIPLATLPAPWSALMLHPLPLQQGRTGGLIVEAVSPGTLTVSFLDRQWDVAAEGRHYEILLAVDRWTEPGIYPLTLGFEDENGRMISQTFDIRVADGGYPSEEIVASEDLVAALNDPVIAAGELAYLDGVMSGFEPERHWADGPFQMPAPGVLASGFGTLRSYNGGGYDTYHSGADIGGPVGTPVYAPADGVVVDTGLLDIRGYITILDHGRGVYSGFWHQSGILVNPGDEVTAGQMVGTIGNTGLSTAAHLHWELRVGGVPVDAMQWVRESFP